MKLHVGNLSPKVTEEQLQSIFSKYGQVLSMQLSWTSRAGRTGGAAIIEMFPAPAMEAVSALNGKAVRNRRLYVTPITGEMVSNGNGHKLETRNETNGNSKSAHKDQNVFHATK